MTDTNMNFSEVFRYGLITKIQQVGGTFNTEIKNDDRKLEQRKFFVFKFDSSHNVEEQILYNLKRMFELVDSSRIEKELGEWKNIEFNVFKVEFLEDDNGFADLYRGIVYFRKK